MVSTNVAIADPVLYGSDETPGIVAVEPDLNSSEAVVFRRESSGITTSSRSRFVPWLVCDREKRFDGATTAELTGPAHRWRVDFDRSGWRGFLDARRSLRQDGASVIAPANALRQFLTVSGMTLFKGMAFSDLRRLQLDIETTGLSPRAPDARIFMASIARSDCFSEAFAGDEREILERIVATIVEWDPDVIEGHNLFAFDLPYIAARCKAHGISFAVGRGDARPMTFGAERNCLIGAYSRPFTPCSIYGRHVIDTYLLTQRFDVARGQISSYGLKECAKVYKIAPPDRVYLDRAQIVEIFARDPETVFSYARQDVEETRALAALVSPTEFHQAQMLPDSYQNLAVSGNGEKLNMLLIREYLRQGVAIPKQKASSSYAGGYTEVRVTGAVSPVVKADVESLYPSIMLMNGIRPASDTLGIFLPLLSELTRRRLDAKTKSRSTERGSTDHAYWDGLQNSFKTLINSFYGYLGGPFPFNDYAAANAVTEAGRDIVKRIAAELDATGSLVIEIDTDGVYFRPPVTVAGLDQQIAYIERIGEALPEGIRLAHDGSYRSMLSLKIKNYVLEEHDGRKIFKGSSLRSRSDEPYGRRFMTTAVDMLLAGETDRLAAIYTDELARIESGGLNINEISRRERVTRNMLQSDLKKRAAEALRDSSHAIGDMVLLYQRRDKTLALADEYADDEDSEYYCAKLYKFALRLRDAIPAETFEKIFPKPVPVAKRPDPTQGQFVF